MLSTLEIVLVRSEGPTAKMEVDSVGPIQRVYSLYSLWACESMLPLPLGDPRATDVGVNAPVVVSHGHHPDYATLPLGGGDVGSLKVDMGTHREDAGAWR